MSGATVAAMLSSGAVAAVTLTFAASDGSEPDGTAREAAVRTPTPTPTQRTRPRGVVENCSTRSKASFPRAFSDPHNVVIGPLVLVGAARTPASTVRELGGQKFPALVRAGHRVTVALSRRTRRVVGLGYGPLPEGVLVELDPRDGHRVVTFVACRRGKRSGSRAEGKPVTFWSGFVLTSSPRCVPLEVWVDDEPSPRRKALRMGVRKCP
jgi:hypothetical protein